MKENLTEPYCYCGESENSLVGSVIFVCFSDGYRGVLLDEISWVEASRSYCVIYMEDDARMTVNYPLDRVLSNDLPRSKFKRIHQSYAIDLFKATRLTGNYVHVGRKMLLVSESRKKDFQAYFHKIYSKRALGK